MSFVFRVIQYPFKTVYDAVSSYVTTSSLNSNTTTVDFDNHVIDVNLTKRASPEQLQLKSYDLRPRKPVNYSV